MALNIPKTRWTLVEAIRSAAEQFAERSFLAFSEGGGFSFDEYDAESDLLAGALAELGVVRGSRVLAFGHNTPQFMLALGATAKRGATFVPVNTELKGGFLEHQVRNAEPTVVVCDHELLSAMATVEGHFDSVRAVVVIGGPADADSCSAFPLARWSTFEQLVATGAAGQVLEPQPSDIAMIMYTSGTTGPSKGVLMPHAHCYVFGLGLSTSVGATEDDHYYVCMPLFHANGMLMQVIGCLIAGTSATVAKRFSATGWLDEVRACDATLTNALGVMPEFIVRQPVTEHDRDNRLRLVMAVPISDEWGTEFEQRFGVKLFQGFGMTECNMIAYTRHGDDLIPGCAGHPLDDLFEVRIVEPDTDEPLAVDQVGEITVRPKEPSCFMAGYDKMPDRTVEAWRNLWFHTGDAGRIDVEGRLHFVDRIKDRIRRRGENISSFEVEQVINNHGSVQESAVVGVRIEDAGGEDELKAAVVLIEGVDLDPVDLLDHCRDNMPRYAVPRFVEFVNELDKTPTGKLRKQGLRDEGVGAAWDRESVGYVIPR
ncbi:MAG: AMP-binding protein [Actinomycetia bacterium]|nr:AMP-binding protein [Actinomycetes bacterium]